MGRLQATRAVAANVAEEQRRCYELQLTGMSVRKIAAETGLAVGTVHKRIHAQCLAVVTPVAEEVRTQQLAQIQEWLARLNLQIREGVAVPRNIEVGTRLLERQAKLLGIDAPEKLEATVTEVSQTDRELAELLTEAKAAQAVREQQIREARTAPQRVTS